MHEVGVLSLVSSSLSCLHHIPSILIATANFCILWLLHHLENHEEKGHANSNLIPSRISYVVFAAQTSSNCRILQVTSSFIHCWIARFSFQLLRQPLAKLFLFRWSADHPYTRCSLSYILLYILSFWLLLFLHFVTSASSLFFLIEPTCWFESLIATCIRTVWSEWNLCVSSCSIHL